MFVIEWLFDKMGYTKKVHWADVFATWEEPKLVKKVATKRKSPAKKTQRSGVAKSPVKTVRKKA